jgi:large subunit ribosomal protein L35
MAARMCVAAPAFAAPAMRAATVSVEAVAARTYSVAARLPVAQSALARPLATTSVSSCMPSAAPAFAAVSVVAAVPTACANAFSPLTVVARGFHVKRKTNTNTKRYKLKSHRATAKRFDVTAGGKIMRWRSGHRHLLRRKGPRQLKQLNQRVEIPSVLYRKYRRSLPYSF